MAHLILAINPGSTSTKIGLFSDNNVVFRESIEHDNKELEKYPSIVAQREMRLNLVLECLKNHGCNASDLSATVGRGGLFPPVKTGGYKVNQKMKDMILYEQIPAHASNLGAILADDISSPYKLPAYIYDAVSASDFDELVMITGIPEIKRLSFSHVLNSRAMAIKQAESMNKKYEELNFIVAHLGGGISMNVHKQGKIVDSTSDDFGSFSPERSGSAPLLDFIELCYSGKYQKKEMQRKVRGMGGLKALLGTPDCREVEKMIQNGDKHAQIIFDAMAYQTAKGIGHLAPVLKGRCDGIILTGGIAHSKPLIAKISEYVSFIAPIFVLPGEFELEALAAGGLRIITGAEKAYEM